MVHTRVCGARSVLNTTSIYTRFADRSIFAPRRKEAESRSFLDSERVVRKAFHADYGRMLKEDRVLRLVAKADAAVGRGEKSVEDSLEEVRLRPREGRGSFFHRYITNA